MGDDQRGLFMTLACAIWRMRNEWVFKNKRWEIARSLNTAMDGWNNFREAMKRKQAPRPMPRASPCRWNPPKGNVYKANVDAAIDGWTRSGCGLIIWDSKGEHTVAACIKVDESWEVETSEVFAVYQGLRIALEAGMHELDRDGV